MPLDNMALHRASDYPAEQTVANSRRQLQSQTAAAADSRGSRSPQSQSDATPRKHWQMPLQFPCYTLRKRRCTVLQLHAGCVIDCFRCTLFVRGVGEEASRAQVLGLARARPHIALLLQLVVNPHGMCRTRTRETRSHCHMHCTHPRILHCHLLST